MHCVLSTAPPERWVRFAEEIRIDGDKSENSSRPKGIILTSAGTSLIPGILNSYQIYIYFYALHMQYLVASKYIILRLYE